MVLTLKIDLSELSSIPGIDVDKVTRYGKQILKIAKDANKRLTELKQPLNDADGVVPDRNHQTVITLDDDDNNNGPDGSDEEYGDDGIFMDQASSLLDLDESNVVSSRFFPNRPTAQDSSDEYHDAASEQSGPKSRRRRVSKRPRRKAPSGTGFKGKGSKAKSKSGAGTGNRSSSSRKTPKANASVPRIPLAPT